MSPDPELRTTARGNASHESLRKGCLSEGRPVVGFRCVKDLPAPHP